MNETAPFDSFHTIYVCDTSNLTGSKQKTSVDWHFSRGADADLLQLCRGGDVSGFADNSNLHEDVVGAFFDERRLAAMQAVLGPVKTTSSFDGYEHHYIYASDTPLDLGKEHRAFASAELADAPFVKLTLKTQQFKVGAVTGVRKAVPYGSEVECTAVAEYTFEIVNPSPWSNVFIDVRPAFWTKSHSACLSQYDDGWRVTNWYLEE